MAFAVLIEEVPRHPSPSLPFHSPYFYKPCDRVVNLVCYLGKNDNGQTEYLVEYDHSLLTDLKLDQNWTSREYTPPDIFEGYIRGDTRAKQLGFLPDLVDAHSYKLNHRLDVLGGNLQSKQTHHKVRVYKITRKLDKAICDYFIGLVHS